MAPKVKELFSIFTGKLGEFDDKKLARFESICLFNSGKIKKKYDDDDKSEDSMPKVVELSWWRRCTIYLMSMLVREYPYLHKMDNLCIDFKQKTVKYEQDQKRFNILRTRSGRVGKYILNEETLKKFADIVAKKQLQEESVNEKVESLQTEMKKLKLSIRSQHEELKKLLQECLEQKRSQS